MKIFNWLGTMYGGSIRWHTAMLFMAAFIVQFTIGGISGILFAVVPLDYASTDTYFVVAHFHYVLFGGTLFLVLGGWYYWFPKMSGRMMSERIGKWNFWTMVLGFNLTFFPQHFLVAMPRRVYTWTNTSLGDPQHAVDDRRLHHRHLDRDFHVQHPVLTAAWQDRGSEPWNAWTLEWMTSSPPAPYNFATIPTVRSRRPLWDLAHPEAPDWRYERSEFGNELDRARTPRKWDRVAGVGQRR